MLNKSVRNLETLACAQGGPIERIFSVYEEAPNSIPFPRYIYTIRGKVSRRFTTS